MFAYIFFFVLEAKLFCFQSSLMFCLNYLVALHQKYFMITFHTGFVYLVNFILNVPTYEIIMEKFLV